HYASCVTYADASVGRIIKTLHEVGVENNTVIVLWGDHGWHLGEHAVWGKHTLFEESLRSPLIIAHPKIEMPGEATEAIVETLDVFPTLCELTNVSVPEFVQGKSLQPFLKQPEKIGDVAVAYSSKGQTIRTDQYRLIVHANGYAELYDHKNQGETKNVADAHPGVVQEMMIRLHDRLDMP
ncbi:MAG: sulfatase-like hydrolase/transferase, partial [Planctomycetaceae bacterium]|nr:sulfatase-like hydrolase/transferase [Planctomycetaceae bacterium]